MRQSQLFSLGHGLSASGSVQSFAALVVNERKADEAAILLSEVNIPRLTDRSSEFAAIVLPDLRNQPCRINTSCPVFLSHRNAPKCRRG